MAELVVIAELGDEEKSLLTGMLGERAGVVFAENLAEEDRFSALERAQIVLSMNPPLEFKPGEYRALEHLQLMQLLSAGADHVPYPLLPPGVRIASNVGAFAEPIAEHVMAMALALAKKLMINHEKLSKGEFDQSSPNISLKGKICGILGFGGNGKAIARLMRSFGVKIYAINRSGKTDEEVNFISTLDDLDYVLRHSDLIVVALPSNRDTRELIGKKELETMKPKAILINIARGSIIDEQALYDHLKDNPNFMVGTDVWWVEPFRDGEFRLDRPFFDLPNFLGSPHNSPMVPGAIEEAVRSASANILRFIDGKPIRGLVRREDYLD